MTAGRGRDMPLPERTIPVHDRSNIRGNARTASPSGHSRVGVGVLIHFC
ncbi:MAG: hypothetical protein AVDCRST_MAG87-2083 [uncultured Thermomicrobiales bacterium]|uniref:Uncharacterized protein n=1 Tax=uncultured Thermomicrobiales bacterium TaxID=1645740 RepID=A0A6J4V413_9BACT|nr:MAG: hypothetical protein AVDCRST_MAG87-2083 [uncultured Thermomicrobiales bacterium]